jgi:Thymidylate kinase
MGKLIAIDGLDGSGKGTQADILASYIRNETALSVRELSFPVYGEDSSLFVRMYLSGKFGESPDDTGPYAASMFFAADRYVSYVTDWKRDIDSDNTIVLANRYTTANAVHQLAKLPRDEWDAFLDWLIDFEFVKLALPVPDLVIYLELKPEHSLSLVEKRSAETGRAMDIHELDRGFMERSYEAAMYASERLGWHRIRCYDGDEIRTVDDISAEIARIVTSSLAV